MAHPASEDASLLRRCWPAYVDVVTVLWLVLFLLALLHTDVDVLDLLPDAAVVGLEEVLFLLSGVYVTDLYLQYRWSGLSRGRFARTRLLDILMAVPFLRFLRGANALRAGGHSARMFLAASRVRKGTSLYRKSRRVVRSGSTLRERRRRRTDL